MHASKTGRGSGHFIQTKSAHVKHSVGNLFCSNTQFFLYKKLGSGNEYSVSYRINPNIRACPYKRKLGKGAHNSIIRVCPSVRVKIIFSIAYEPNFRIEGHAYCPFLRVKIIFPSVQHPKLGNALINEKIFFPFIFGTNFRI